MDMSKVAARPDLYKKKVTWLELFFDLIFALALAMSAKPLEHISDFSWTSFLGLAEFLLIFFFLIMFWYRHMVLMNRFDHTSFLTTLNSEKSQIASVTIILSAQIKIDG